LLTARAAAEDKIGGLESGADDYLLKPFAARELQVRVKNLIEQRRKLRDRFSREIMLQPLDIALTSIDEKFMQRLVTIIEKELANPLFDVATFVKESGMSRANLYRKLQALCGQSAKEFIRTIRLKRAAQMLLRHSASVAEIAFEVGFNNPSYFAECFRRQFGISPSVYASEHSR
jgi:AraC-like DNA-binding protein